MYQAEPVTSPGIHVQLSRLHALTQAHGALEEGQSLVQPSLFPRLTLFQVQWLYLHLLLLHS